MTNLTNDKLKKLLAVAGEAFDKQVSPALGLVYWEGLKGHESEAVEAAFAKAMREDKFFPRLAELLEFLEGNPRTRAEISWAGVLELIRKHGSMRGQMVSVDGATAWAVERMGGVGILAKMNVDSLRFENKRYFALHEHATRQGLHETRALLYGEKERKFLSHEFVEPKLIERAPETIAPPKNAALALESETQKLIAHKIDSHTARLAEMKAMP